jgi:predicted phosphodiesterase
MIVVKGNNDGKTIHVLECIHGFKSNFNQVKSTQSSFQIFVAAGPFTLHQDLNYDPLIELMNQIEKEKPNVVILVKEMKI